MNRKEYYALRENDPDANKAPWRGESMLIFETINCPTCSGKIAVIIEDNVITSHGVCPGCDNTFSAERLMFMEQCKAFEDEFMDLMLPCHPELGIHTCGDSILCEAEWELGEFYHELTLKGVTDGHSN